MLVTGPTGSGKTTTLYSTLKQLATPDVNVCTVEDPIEMVEPPFNQMQVQHGIGLDFASGVRTLMRQDPDIIMVGEIRDLETAEMAIQAALTGHLVLSTLHTNDAPSAITRLLDLGVPPYLLNSTMLGVMAQRLVRTLCPHCKEQRRARGRGLGAAGRALESGRSRQHDLRRQRLPRMPHDRLHGPRRHLRNDVLDAELRKLISDETDLETAARAGLPGRHEAAAHQRRDEGRGGPHHHRGSHEGRAARCRPARRRR